MTLIHIWRMPRTAGTSIRNGLTDMGVRPVGFRDYDPAAPVLMAGHETPDDVVRCGWMTAEQILAGQNFLCLRNVWDRLVSLYSLLHQRGKNSPELARVAENEAATFGDYINWCTRPKRETTYHRRNYQCQPVGDWLTVGGRPIPFALGWFHRLSDYWDTICAAVGRKGPLPRKNHSAHDHYQEYFTRPDREKVERFYAAEIEQCRWEY